MLIDELSAFLKQLNELLHQTGYAQWVESVCHLYRSYTGYGVKLTLANGETVTEILPESVNYETELSAIFSLPITRNEKQIGTLLLTGYSQNPIEENNRMAAEVLQALFTIMLHKNTHKGLEAVRSAVNSLSFSELEAAVQIAKRLKNNEGLIVAAKVSGEIKITRPVIVNALRKLEGSGMIETRSLGMKGTYIKIKNELLAAELKKL